MSSTTRIGIIIKMEWFKKKKRERKSDPLKCFLSINDLIEIKENLAKLNYKLIQSPGRDWLRRIIIEDSKGELIKTVAYIYGDKHLLETYHDISSGREIRFDGRCN